MKKNETGEEAARREVKEEVGLAPDTFTKLGTFFNTAEYKKDTVTIFLVDLPTPISVQVDNAEIERAEWLDPATILDTLSLNAKAGLTMLRERSQS